MELAKENPNHQLMLPAKKILMVDLNGQYQRIKPEIDQAIQSVLHSTAFIQGPQVKSFEKAFSDFHEGVHTITCGNGTDALQIAMMALDFKPGAEVIIPVFNYVANVEILALLGLKAVFVEVESTTFNIDASKIEEKITPKTVALIAVHLFGQCANMEAVLAIASKHKLKVIEDYAQAIGSVYTFRNGTKKMAGTMGDIGCTSFFPSKNLGCYGDGGAVVTTDKLLGEKIKMIANHGQRIKYHHEIVGVNSRLDTMQAAILEVKLKSLKEYEQKRNAAADFYDRELNNLPFLEIPYRDVSSTHVFHQYTLKVKEINREDFKNHLEKNGIPSMVYYPLPLHLQKAYNMEGRNEGSFPLSEDLCERVLSLPMHTEMDEQQLGYICGVIKNYKG
jgi:UDP-2-acetamido-2-deoxy-ribo-hexuluronate aminotransferase